MSEDPVKTGSNPEEAGAGEEAERRRPRGSRRTRATNRLRARRIKTSAVAVERLHEQIREPFRVRAFDLVALDHGDDLPVLEQSDLRRAGRVVREEAARVLRR